MNTKMIAALFAATALTSASAFATPLKFTGDLYVGAGTQNATDNSDLNDASPIFVGGRGSLYIPFSNTKLSVTIDAFAENGIGIYDEGYSDRDYFSYGGAAHFTYTQGARYSLGVVGSVFTAESPENEDPSYFLFGAEGKFMLDRGSFWGQAGYFDFLDDQEDDTLSQASFVRFGVNYYLEDDLKLSGEVGFYDGVVEQDDGAIGKIYRVELEQRVWDWVSIYGAYQFTGLENNDEGDDYQGNMFNVGVRFRLGDGNTGTLLSNEQTNSIGTPLFLNMIGVSNEFD